MTIPFNKHPKKIISIYKENILIIFLFPACSEKVKTLPEIDLKEIHLDQCQILYYDKLEYYDLYGIIYLKKDGYIDENNIRDMKIFKNNIFILTHQDRVYRYNMENSKMEQSISQENIYISIISTSQINFI